ncbi:hypothetical protein TMFG_04042, partial [Mycobacterium tuberculosis SUMu006]
DDRVDVDVPIVESSDPKPREGTETWSVSPQTARLRQVVRPKTPRGDGNPQLSIADAVQLVRVVRPKNPREGTETQPHRLLGETCSPRVVRPKTLNRPGMSGDSSSWKGWGHVRWFIEEVPAGAA